MMNEYWEFGIFNGRSLRIRKAYVGPDAVYGRCCRARTSSWLLGVTMGVSGKVGA